MHPDVVDQMRGLLVAELTAHGIVDALDGTALRSEPYQEWELRRIYQFDRSRGVTGFPAQPAEVVVERR